MSRHPDGGWRAEKDRDRACRRRSVDDVEPMPTNSPSVILDEFERRWKAGQRPALADALPCGDTPEARELAWELVKLDLYYRVQMGEQGLLAERYLNLPGLALAAERRQELAGLEKQYRRVASG